MRNFNGCRLLLLLIPSLFLLLPVGVLTLALERISSSLLLAQTYRNVRDGGYEITLYGPTTTGSKDFINTDVTLNFNFAPTLAILGICIVSYFVGALTVFGVWELRKIEGPVGHQRGWTWTVVVSNVIMIGSSVGVLAYASSVQSREKGWQRYEDVGKDDSALTRETWACQIDRLYPDQNWASSSCGAAKATRFMLLAMAVSSVLAIITLWVLVRDRGGFNWLFGGKGRYGGFPSVYEMQIPHSAPPPPHNFQQAPQWAPQFNQQWTPGPINQIQAPGTTKNQSTVLR